MSSIRYVLPFEQKPPTGGACAGYPVEWWFPEKHAKGVRAKDVVVAKQICSECAVREECLEYSISAQEMYGIWGGKSIDERSAITNQRRKNGTLKLYEKIPVNEQYL